MTWGALWDLVRDAQLAARALCARRTPRAAERARRPARAVHRRTSRTSGRRLRLRRRRRPQLLPETERVLAPAPPMPRAPTPCASRSSTRSSASRNRPTCSPTSTRRSTARRLLGLPLRAPTRWAIVTHLASLNAPTARARLAAESKRDSTSEGKRRAFVAGAAWPDAAVKAQYWHRYFADSTLNEDWVTASLGAFNDPDQEALTRRYLVPALDTLPWIQRNRRIFFLGSWLGAFIGGQRSAESLASRGRFLGVHEVAARPAREDPPERGRAGADGEDPDVVRVTRRAEPQRRGQS